MITGIVLAAGRSRRMGRPKALLQLGGETFLARAVGALAAGGCGSVVVVAPAGVHGAARVAEAARAAGARVLAASPDAEQIDSLQVALRALTGRTGAVVVTPVDIPLLSADAVRAVIEAHRRTGKPIARAVHRGRHGHPVLFARALFSELLEDGLDEGARSVVHRHAGEVVEVEIGEPGVLLDVNTPADYERLRAEGP